MTFAYSEKFLNSINKSNLEIADELLQIFNAAFVSIKRHEKHLVLSFKIWNKHGLTDSTFVKCFNIHDDCEYLAKRIITECDQDAFTRDTVLDEVRISIEKYGLMDFIQTVVDDFTKQEIGVSDQIQMVFSVEPIDAKIIVNGNAVTTINGVYSGLFFEDEIIKIRCEHDGYISYEREFIATVSEPFKIVLKQIKHRVHIAPVPSDAEVILYKGNVPKQQNHVSENTSLTDEIPVQSLDDDKFAFPVYEEVELSREQDMLLADLPEGDYTLTAKKRLFAPYHEQFTISDNVFKVVSLCPHFVHVELSADPVYSDAYTSLNGKSIELPYSFNMAIGESALIESIWNNLQYRNYIIANEADVRNGLNYQISFIRKFTIDLRVPSGAHLYINNELQSTEYYSGEFTQGSRVDVRVEKEGYVPIAETFEMMRDIQKVYEMETKVPYHTFRLSVTPQDAYVTLNGAPVVNPFESDFIEGSEVTVRATKQNYISYNETIVMNGTTERNVILEQYDMFKPTVTIKCNVADTVCFVNDQETTLPAKITVEQGSQLKVNIHAEGYKDHNEIIEVQNLDITREIELKKLTQGEIDDVVNIIINVNRINSIVMLNNKQIDGEIIYSDTGDIVNYLFKTTVPRGTYCQLQVTNPGYYPYFETFVPVEDFERNVILSKEPQYNLYRVNVFSRTAGSILEVNGKKVSSPYVHDYLEGSEIFVKCYADGFTPYEYSTIIDQDLILSIELEEDGTD